MPNDDVLRLHERLDELGRKIDGQREDMAALSKSIAARDVAAKWCQEMNQRHNATLYGNGHDGLCTRVDRIEQLRKIVWGLVGTVAGGLLTLAAALLQAWAAK